MTGLVLNMTGFVLYMTGIVKNMTESDDYESNGMAYMTVWTVSRTKIVFILISSRKKHLSNIFSTTLYSFGKV